MSEKNIDIVEELLPRYCEGNVSAEEREKVEKWIRQSEEHYKIARQIQLIYLASDTISVMDRVNTDNALSKVDNRIFRSQLKALFILGAAGGCHIIHPVAGCLSVASTYS